MRAIDQKLSNVPFFIKFLTAPVVAIILMVALNTLANAGLNRSSAGISHIVDHTMAGNAALSEVRSRMHQAAGDMYRLLTEHAVKPLPPQDLAARLGAIKANLQTMSDILARYRDTYARDENKPQLDEAIKRTRQVSEGMDVLASMLDIDLGSAVSFVAPFDAIFKNLVQTVDTLTEEAAADSRRRAEQASQEAHDLAREGMALTVLALVLIGLSAGVIGGSTTRSIRGIADVTLALAHGDTAVDIPSLRRRDELGSMVSSLETFATLITERQKDAIERQAREAEMANQRRAMRDHLAVSVEQQMTGTIHTVAHSAAEMKGAAQSLTAVADLTAQRVSAACSASAQATSNIATVAAAAEELTQSISEIGRQLKHASETSQAALAKTKDARGTVANLAEAAGRIGEVVSLITDIASQTNLLALNASIEAARAGDAGKGFAVVAGEVKALANQTASATGEITQQITSVQQTTDKVVAAIQDIVTIIGDISAVSTAIASAVEQQHAATREIARNVDEARGQAQAVDANIQGVTDGAANTKSAASEVLSAVNSLEGMAEGLKAKVAEIVTGIRA